MKKIILPLIVLFLSLPFAIHAQQTMVENFDNISVDTNYVWTGNTEGAPSYLTVKEDSVDKKEGAASLDIKTAIGAFHGWGSYSQLLYRLPTDQKMDFSSSDTFKIWIKVVTAPKIPANMLLRFTLIDQDAPGDPTESYVMDNFIAIDSATDWYLLKIPLHEINSQNGTVVPGDSGFVMVPYTWGGFTYNDHKLNLDKIVGWNIGFITSGYDPNANLPADSLELKLDGFLRTGNKAVPFIVFNGLAVPNNLSLFTWGNASVDIQEKNGPIPNTNTIHWLMGDQWGNGWNGFGYNISPAFNLSGGWPVDSLSFYMKADTGVAIMRAQFEDGNAQLGYAFNVIQDTSWHRYAIALRDITKRVENPPKSGDFNTAAVTVFQFMPEGYGTAGNAYGKAGKNVWFSDIWTGNPSAPVPPVAPLGVNAIPNNNFTNSVIWSDVPGQSGETYNIFYSASPITDVTAAGVEVAGTAIAHGAQIFIHQLLAPATDQSVSYYYAVVCKSGDGLLGTPGTMASKVTNTAKGVIIINPTAPSNFVADGDLTEWTTAGIKPFRMFVSDHSGTVVTNTNVPSDEVSSGEVYVAVDQNYLYVAGHINTNNVFFNPALSTWFNTATDIFLGLYDAHGAPHSALQTGATPDYHIRFIKTRAIIDNDGVDSLVAPGANYFWLNDRFPDPLAGYNFEAKISWQDLAHKSNTGNTRSDNVFVPKVGMRIPFDIELSSVSPTATQRDGQLDYSSIANGNSYGNVALWSNSWVGDQWYVGVKDNNLTVNTYQLAQNYPNPFNPTTKIQYSLMKPGMVTLTIYDILGRKISTLVNRNETAGAHTVSFDASRYTSGVYFYRIESGSFTSVKKMMLLK